MLILENSGKHKKNVVIAISAGGTGGHIFPALAIAKLLIKEGYYILFYTDKKFFNYIDLKEDFFLKSGMMEIIQLRTKNSKRWKQIIMIIRDFFACRKILTQRVSVSIGFGGLISFAPMLFSIITFRKTIIHEQNIVIGLTNKVLLPFVKKCLLSFRQTSGVSKNFKKKCVFVGNPIREEIKKLVYNYDNPSVNYKAFYKIDDIINLTIIGGSQACSVFDDIIPEAISILPVFITNKLRVYHQCKKENINKLEIFYTENGISHVVNSFFYKIGDLLRASHLVISRAGSTIISEISALGTPSVLIPLPTSANNHQFYNAKFLRDNNATILVEQKDLTKEILCQLLTNLFIHDRALFELSKSCRNLANVNADVLMLDEIKKVIGTYEKTSNESVFNAKNVNYINDNVGLG